MEIDGISMVREYAEPNMEAAKILRQILLTAKNFAAANSKIINKDINSQQHINVNGLLHIYPFPKSCNIIIVSRTE